ncbi:MAG: transporter substrate-binding domain-containing protein [Melioribacteraceae bacterium]|nr:transporter substrate-binding domain-containing protein [Melioribacteraceae bacterium]MCF8354453.1 transporter substrate-binding domain-containing protein [Melioribacteraceae bacterium]MCF8394063.1 transporter substrate-binding domain-containing protein [Melioribacteraceae bacterium]MCF8419829.1 transporter substrate-binding domain-containing protein [Melioribacteraceae bacterium]
MKKLLFILSLVLLVENYSAQEKLQVGIKIAEPFIIKNADSTWRGLSWSLWTEIADNLNLEYEVKEYTLEELLAASENSKIDIAVSPLTITSDREKKMDFTHPYFVTGLSIAVPLKTESDWITVAKRIFSGEFINVVGALIVLLFIVGLVTWLFERKKNPEQFSDGHTKGIGSSFWWAAVTMTTVGYGDKAPVTTGGRIIALIWMFAGIIIISSFTAAIASALTVTQLDTQIRSVNDLYDVSVGTVASSSSAGFLKEKRIDFNEFDSPYEALLALNSGMIDAVVYDAPILKYLVKSKKLSGKIKVLPENLDPLYYGFALPSGSSLIEPLNRQILELISKKDWNDLKFEYFGE